MNFTKYRSIALACALGSGVAAAQAAGYFLVVPVLSAAPTNGIKVSLAPATLALAKVGRPYSATLRDYVSVIGDSSFNVQGVTLAAQGGGLPPGLTLDPSGAISGTPTGEASASFQVEATYKSSTGQQTYTIHVGGVGLDVTKISAGDSFTCAITPAGAAKCWGMNGFGELGIGSTSPITSEVPLQVLGLTSGVTDIAVGFSHTCAVHYGAVKCWGTGYNGQLGDNSSGDQMHPVNAIGLESGVTAVTAGQYHSCAIQAGAVKCWGLSDYGQVGTTVTNNRTPVPVAALSSGVSAISGGAAHTCAIQHNSASCWGRNNHGQLGNNGSGRSIDPVAVLGLGAGVTHIAAGLTHSCAIQGGAAKCWGYGYDGVLGNNGTTTTRYPVDVVGMASGVTGITSGKYHNCAIQGGAAKCWGSGDGGQLGNGSSNNQVPELVTGLTSGVSAMSAGWRYTCAIHAGVGKCWGDGSNGQLGNNDDASQATPVLVHE